MILCICLSPALDVTYHLPALTAGAAHRVSSVATRPGGKAVNVARVLGALGEDTHLLAPVGGLTGSEFEQTLAEAGVSGTLVRGARSTRRTVTVVEGTGLATTLSEPAALDQWAAVRGAAAELIPRARSVVISGAVPDGVPEGGLGQLVE